MYSFLKNLGVQEVRNQGSKRFVADIREWNRKGTTSTSSACIPASRNMITPISNVANRTFEYIIIGGGVCSILAC